jgi:hypothetical protein
MGTSAQIGETVAQETDSCGASCLDGGALWLGAVAFLSPSAPVGDSQDLSPWLLCSYRNATNRMVIVRVRGAAGFFLERVVFPFEIMTFHSPGDGEVEVTTRTPSGQERTERIASHHLLAAEPNGDTFSDWRPPRSLRSVSVRGNASTTCREGL